MIHRVSVSVALLLAVGSAPAGAGGPEFQIVPVETGAEAIDRVFVFDLLIPLDEFGWNATEAHLQSVGGALLQYHVRPDANGVDQPLLGPGADNPYNTFVSLPYRQFSSARFDQATTSSGFAFLPPSLDALEYSVGYVKPGAPVSFPLPALAVVRVAFEAPDPGGLSFGDVYFAPAARGAIDDPNTALPSDAGHARLLTMRSGHTIPPFPPLVFNGAFFAVPEPASFALLALGAALGFRRR